MKESSIKQDGIVWRKLKDYRPPLNKRKPYKCYLIATSKEVEWKMAYYDYKDNIFRYTPLMKVEKVIWWAEMPTHPKNIVELPF